MTLPPWRTLAIIGGAVAAVALLATAAWMWNAAQQQRAAAAYAEVLTRHRLVENPEVPAAARQAAMRDLEQVLGQYPSSHLAGQAAYLLGSLRFGDGQHER